jgi:uncharacterized protein YycO
MKKKPIKPDIKKHDRLVTGDIVICMANREFFNCHAAMCIGYNLFIESGPFCGVTISTRFKLNKEFQRFRYRYVKEADSIIRKKAVKWAIGQLGKPYQFYKYHGPYANYNPNDTSDKNSRKWYCSELIWAAYYNATKDTDNLINLGNQSKLNEQDKNSSQYHPIWVSTLEEDNVNMQEFDPVNPPLPIKKN